MNANACRHFALIRFLDHLEQREDGSMDSGTCAGPAEGAGESVEALMIAPPERRKMLRKNMLSVLSDRVGGL